jgi:hypothetical protein
MKFKSKVVEIEAIQFNSAQSPDEMMDAWGEKFQKALSCHQESDALIIKTLEGDMRAQLGDWIIKGTEGEFYPCKPSVFARKYEAI